MQYNSWHKSPIPVDKHPHPSLKAPMKVCNAIKVKPQVIVPPQMDYIRGISGTSTYAIDGESTLLPSKNKLLGSISPNLGTPNLFSYVISSSPTNSTTRKKYKVLHTTSTLFCLFTGVSPRQVSLPAPEFRRGMHCFGGIDHGIFLPSWNQANASEKWHWWQVAWKEIRADIAPLSSCIHVKLFE